MDKALHNKLVQLLLSTDPSSVLLGLTLLEPIAYKKTYLRLLNLIHAQNSDFEVRHAVADFLETYLKEAWAAVRPELQWYGVMKDNYDRLSQEEFLAILALYEPHRALYEPYLHKDSRYVHAYVDLAKHLHDLQARAAALDYMGYILRCFPDHAIYLNWYVAMLGKTPETLPQRLHYLERAANSPDTTPKIVYQLGRLYWIECHDLPTALRWFNTAVALPQGSRFASCWLSIAQVAEQLIQTPDDAYWVKTCHALDQCLHLSPQNRRLVSHYVFLLLRYEQNYARALQLIQQSRQVIPFSPDHSWLKLVVYWCGYRDVSKTLELLQQLPQEHRTYPRIQALKKQVDERNFELPVVKFLSL